MKRPRNEMRVAPGLAREERRRRVSELVLKGLSQEQIAAELGISDSTVCRDLKVLSAGWQRQATAAVGEHIAKQDARLEALNAAIWDVAMAGDPQSVDTCLRIMKRKAALLGLDKAGKVDLTIHAQEDQDLEAKLQWMHDNLQAGKDPGEGLPSDEEGDAGE